ncbi:hypothetical protein B7P43_G04575 [Cryptotermes secundus]|uniref:HTH CENPB-type domain-containing protein n=2 Tax=Cryptotermes secundus TaxID=105785 RepID=A0A2J7PI99_9NEOP|nr:tigger transposable element-derived protein 4 [Cryptotermes secundus]XP_023724503.1 tigger transposable element-derived protein 4 [Cryptotermes secundus]XP_023724504.1 tigger transposable element-derived protein 4 [Cryptotermes secundus]XP_023724505.1 tigger transposable element-derived protein 4 [Cryptotermes secundus]XP_023724507.1 tigger transposable element-derived protein 4 [Cryptotermes secundus]XP_023724508.1 tigger transposable element-derived protein 4 [Cryptotermes secundus]XP_02
MAATNSESPIECSWSETDPVCKMNTDVTRNVARHSQLSTECDWCDDDLVCRVNTVTLDTATSHSQSSTAHEWSNDNTVCGVNSVTSNTAASHTQFPMVCDWSSSKLTKPQCDKKKGEVLSLKLRVEVIRESSSGLSQRALALKFNCSKTQIQNILKDKDRLLREWKEGGSQFAKRKRRQRNENVNNFVWEWFKEARARGLPLSGPILQEKAREFAAFFNIEKFNASNGWLDSFKKRHNIVFREILGESEMEEADWRLRVATMCEGYELRNIFNMDETGLFFRAVPDKTIGQEKMYHGGELAGERLTLSFCINALGEKEPPVVIYSKCSKENDAPQLGVEQYANINAWMTPDIFCQWVTKLNEKMIQENRKILLFLDDAPCHPLLELSNINFIFLPASSASRLQPLEQGIIQAFKVLYRRRMLRSLVARMNGTISIRRLAHQITVSDAITWVKSAWMEVKPAVAQRLFAICGIKTEQTCATLEDDIATELDNVAIEVSSLGEAAGIDVELEPEGSHSVPCYDAGSDWEQQLLGVAWGDEPSADEEADKAEEPSVMPLPLSQALSSIAALKALTVELGSHDKLMKALEVAEEEFENIIVKERCQY